MRETLTPPRRADRSAADPLRTRARAIAAHRETRHAAKYAIVGVANAVIEFALYAALVHLGVWYVAAKVVAVLAANANGYTFNRLWTFRAGPHQHATLVRYAIVQGTGLLLNLGLLTVMVEILGVGEIVAGGLAIPVVAAYCFLANRFWTFGRHIG